MTTVTSHRSQDELEWLAGNPHAKVNGVEYVLDYGEGHTVERMPWGFTEYGPVWVWRAVCDLDYTAPQHVADAAYEWLAEADEVARLEAAAGWDPNP